MFAIIFLDRCGLLKAHAATAHHIQVKQESPASETLHKGVPAMLRTPFKMEWSPSFPKARRVRKTLDPEAWERMASPNLIRMLATLFIIPGYILALLFIFIALCTWIMSSPASIQTPSAQSPAPMVTASTGNKSIAFAGNAVHATLVMATSPGISAK